MDVTQVQQIRQEMERIEARKLQPHFIASFFLEAFQRLGGTIRQREPKRYEITHVPAVIRQGDRGKPILRRYERICFEKSLITVPGQPPAEFICPGHPLLDAVLDLTLDRHRELLRQGAILVDEDDPGEEVRVLAYLEHSIQDGSIGRDGRRRLVSRRMQYVEIFDPHPPTPSPQGRGGEDSEPSPSGRGQGEGQGVRDAGYAPYLDYRPLTPDEQALLADPLCSMCLRGFDLEAQATTYAITHLVPQHLQEVRGPKEALINKTIRAVKDRLTKEINYWDQRASELRLQEQAGKPNAKLNSAKAQQRADELADRLQKRLAELEQERQLSPLPPVVIVGALVVPIGLLQRLQGKRASAPATFARETQRVEQAAMAAVLATERALGYEPRDVSAQKCGYDIESAAPLAQLGRGAGGEGLRFIEVKGRIAGAETVTVTKNEILTALNKPNNFILALVQVPADRDFLEGDAFQVRESSGTYAVPGEGCVVRYVKAPFQREPDFGASSVNYAWQELWERGYEPQRHGEH